MEVGHTAAGPEQPKPSFSTGESTRFMESMGYWALDGSASSGREDAGHLPHPRAGVPDQARVRALRQILPGARVTCCDQRNLAGKHNISVWIRILLTWCSGNIIRSKTFLAAAGDQNCCSLWRDAHVQGQRHAEGGHISQWHVFVSCTKTNATCGKLQRAECTDFTMHALVIYSSANLQQSAEQQTPSDCLAGFVSPHPYRHARPSFGAGSREGWGRFLQPWALNRHFVELR